MLAGGQDGISFVNPIGEIFLHPLAGTMHFYFFLLVLFFLLFLPFSISSFLLPLLLPFPFMHFMQAYFTLQASSSAVVIVLNLSVMLWDLFPLNLLSQGRHQSSSLTAHPQSQTFQVNSLPDLSA